VRERLPVNKQESHRFHMARFNLKKVNEVDSKDKYHAEVLILHGKQLEREMLSSWMLCPVALVQTDISEECSACIILYG
jgi:hypothetical protein